MFILLLFYLTKYTRISSARKYEMNGSFRRDENFQHDLKYHFSRKKKTQKFSNFLGFFKLSCGFPSCYQIFHKVQKCFILFLNFTWRKKTPKHTLCLPTRIKVLTGETWGLMQHMDCDINILTIVNLNNNNIAGYIWVCRGTFVTEENCDFNFHETCSSCETFLCKFWTAFFFKMWSGRTGLAPLITSLSYCSRISWMWKVN